MNYFDFFFFVSENKLAHISYESGNKVKITWCPTVKDQVLFSERGINGQFIIHYDVDHNDSTNQILVRPLFIPNIKVHLTGKFARAQCPCINLDVSTYTSTRSF